MSTKPYDQSDFGKNPGKYRLFKTAKVVEEVPSAPELKIGEIYNISYYGTAVNTARAGAKMPIYKVWVNDKEESVLVYACVLGDFVL